jgi:predicted component of type VI protein secretion system
MSGFFICAQSFIAIFAPVLPSRKLIIKSFIYFKYMKKIIFIVLGIILVGIGCTNEQKRMDKMTNKLLTRISNTCQLSPDQVTKITPIAESFVKLRKETKDKYENDQEAFRNAMEINRKKFIDTIKTILTPDQFEKLKTSFQQQRAKQSAEQEGGSQD